MDPNRSDESKLQPGIEMAALGTRRNFSTLFFSVEMITTNAVKSNFAAFSVIETTIPTIIIDPQNPKYSEDQETVENNLECKIRGGDHNAKFTRTRRVAKGK
jgi:hypothetical protein